MNISIEFSPKLGVRELPEIDSSHQSNVRGIYVVGDLADAPIIKVALRQGYEVAQQVMSSLKERPALGGEGAEVLDVVVIGAGPAGIGAALALREAGASFVVIERERPFSTIQNFPKGKMIFSEPRELASPGNLWFEDASKEELVERWDEALSQHTLPIQQPEEVVDVQRKGSLLEVKTRVGEGGLDVRHVDGAQERAAAENRYLARRVILATGKRGQVRKLGIPGEDLDHVSYALKDPAAWAGQRVVVIGGGDSAVETACSLADRDAAVTISYRQEAFHRIKAGNRERIRAHIDAGRIDARLPSKAVEITPSGVVLESGGEVTEVPAAQVFVNIGTSLPYAFLRRLGVRMKGEMTATRIAWILSFALTTYLFYILKSGAECVGGSAAGAACVGGQWVAKKALFPFGPDHILAALPGLLKVDLGFRVVDGAFWGTSTYAMLILIFGIRALRRYPDPVQKKRYLSLIAFQWIFLFGIPEVLAPLLIHLGGEGGPMWMLLGGDRAWKFYALSVPWPLNTWALIDAPSWTATGSTVTVGLWLALAGAVSFVAIPLYVRRNGERFCSYLCGCGGLAETLGDLWRHLAPRGITARKSERMGRIIMLLAIPTTLLILNDAWGFISSDALYNAKTFAQRWYGLMVDFWLASIVGVALYPYLGSRVWCRFFCPLRAYMEELSRRFSRIGIDANDKCIGCGECTRYCQMGIDVQKFAQKMERMSNGNSACIQCGICVQVCPMDVLSVTRGEPVSLNIAHPLRPPLAEWEERSW